MAGPIFSLPNFSLSDFSFSLEPELSENLEDNLSQVGILENPVLGFEIFDRAVVTVGTVGEYYGARAEQFLKENPTFANILTAIDWTLKIVNPFRAIAGQVAKYGINKATSLLVDQFIGNGYRGEAAIAGASGAIALAAVVAGSTKLSKALQNAKLYFKAARDFVLAKPKSRLPQDTRVNSRAPAAMGLNRPIGQSRTQNTRLQSDIVMYSAQGATDFRVNQQQVNAKGNRVGVNRPDLQFTDRTGRRVYVEYDTRASNRGPIHEARIRANDSRGRVVLVEQD